MIYCFTIELSAPVATQELGPITMINEFNGSTADQAVEATLEVLCTFGLEVKNVVRRAIAGDQDIRRYPFPEMVHGLPFRIAQEACQNSYERKLN